MKIRDIAAVIEEFAPLSLQAEYDNSGLIVGRMDDEVHSALLAVDVTEEVLDEAIAEGCDIIITHHPIIFSPIKRLNSATYVERCVERAIRHAIEVARSRGRIDGINNILGVRAYLNADKPTNSESIALIADKMLLEKA